PHPQTSPLSLHDALPISSDPPADIYLALKADPNSTDQAHYLRAAARLKPGVTLEKAKAAMKVAAEQFNRKFAAAAGAQLGPQGRDRKSTRLNSSHQIISY